VVLLSGAAETAWMHKVAAEMNLSETAFLTRRGEGEFDLRWFTPAVEVDLCGHATLASAHALWQGGHAPAVHAAAVPHEERRPDRHPAGGWIELDFPAHHVKTAEAPDGLLDALRAQAKYVGRSKFDYLVEVGSEDTVRELKPDFVALRSLCRCAV
jgi:predicted PhzF superfamily epimerase YddE/YHI9